MRPCRNTEDLLEPPSEQAHFSAEQPAPRQDARLPSADADACRPRHRRQPAQQGPRAAVGLTHVRPQVPAVLPSENRLRRREDFTTAVRRGRRAGRPHLVVHLSRRTDPHAVEERHPPPRAGFVVSKTVGNAVVRNRVQRRLRHLIRDRLYRLPAGSLVVVRALPGARAATYDQLARDLDAALERLLGGVRP